MATKTRIDTEDQWSTLQGCLPSDYVEKAEVFGFKFSQPKYLNTKITHIDQILRLVLFMVANGLSLRSAAALGSVAGMPQLSAVALHKWMKKIGDYIFWLLEEVSDCREIYASHRWGQYDVIATDATTAERPGATGTTARVHVALRLSRYEASKPRCQQIRWANISEGLNQWRRGSFGLAIDATRIQRA